MGKSLFLKIFYFARNRLVIQSCLQILSSSLAFVSPLALQVILRFLNDSETKETNEIPRNVVLATLVMFLTPLILAFTNTQIKFIGHKMGSQAKAVLSAAIYDKVLRLNIAGTAQTTGQITNLLSTDAETVLSMVRYSSMMWSSGLEVVICFCVLYYLIGWGVLGAFAFVAVALPVSQLVISRLYTVEEEQLELKDKRVAIVSEVLNNIRTVKVFAWEPRFLSKISNARIEELRSMKSVKLCFVFIDVLWCSSPVVIAICSLITYTIILGNRLDLATGK